MVHARRQGVAFRLAFRAQHRAQCDISSPANDLAHSLMQDQAERSVLVRMEGSRAVPAMLLVEATSRLNVRSKPLRTVGLHCAVGGPCVLQSMQTLSAWALAFLCPASPTTVPMLCCAACRWALQHMQWTPCCFTWSAATRQPRLAQQQAASQRQQQRQRQLPPCTQSTPPVSRGCTNHGSVAVCSPAPALHRPGLQTGCWPRCAPNCHACPC